jgi:O-antigen/teichoic acid export membrane protein
MYLKSALKGTVIVFIISIVGGFFGYLMRIILARSLTIVEFGLFYSVLTVFMFISYFVDAGLGQAVSRKIVELRVKDKTKNINNLIWSTATIQFVTSLCLSILLLIFSNFLSKNYFHADVSKMILLLTVWLMTMPLVSLFSYTFYGFKRSDLFSVIDLLKYFFLCTLSFLGLYFGLGLNAPVWAYVCTNILIILLCLLIIWRVYPKFSFKFKFDKKMSIETFRFGSMIFVSNLAWFVITQVDTLTVTYFTNPTQVALYQVAVPLAAILLYFTNAISIVIYPIAAELKILKDNIRLLNGLELVYKYLLIVILPLAVLMFSFPDVIINLLFTSKYLGAIPVMRILSVATVFFSLTIINNAVITAIGKPEKVARMMSIIAVINLILCLILVPKYGIIGASISALISFICASIISSYQVYIRTKFKFPLLRWLLMLVLAVAMIFFISFLRAEIALGLYLKILIILFTVGIVYTSLLFAFRIISLDDIKFILQLLLKK